MPLPLPYADWSRLLSSHQSLKISLDPNPKTLNCESNSIFFCSLLNIFFVLCCSASRHSSVIHFGAFSQLIFWLITVEKNKWMDIGWFHFFQLLETSVFFLLWKIKMCDGKKATCFHRRLMLKILCYYDGQHFLLSCTRDLFLLCWTDLNDMTVSAQVKSKKWS